MIARIKSTICTILFLSFSTTLFGAENSRLNQADSLFGSQKYTEAFEVYQEILSGGEATSSMLLKMAFIQDASENQAEALYYLDLYYQLSTDRQAVGKIETIAQENDLRGYQYDDTDYFLALFKKFRIEIISLLLATSLLLLAYTFSKYRKGERAVPAAIIQVMVVTLLLIAINIQSSQNGIIINDLTLLRSGPSAGAEPIEVLTKGHKVIVLKQSEVWTKILWDGEEVFVRNNRLRLI